MAADIGWLFQLLRYVASALFVRYLYRCVDALKSGVMRRDVVSDNAAKEMAISRCSTVSKSRCPPGYDWH